MMSKYLKCPKCGKVAPLVQSNNPIAISICNECLSNEIDYNNLVQAEFFCRTYNLPWLPEKWIKIAESEPKDIFNIYTTVIAEEYQNTLYNGLTTNDLWKQLDTEWQKVLNHRQLMRNIAPIKDGFMEQMQIKWSPRFTFEEMLKLEDIYNNTMKLIGINNPLNRDMVKKIAVISIDIDKSIESGDIKTAKDLTDMYKNYIKSCGLDEVTEDLSNSNVIRNVADLMNYLESQNFELRYHDGEDQDVVDKTITDMQEWVKRFVIDSTGLNTTFETIKDAYENKLELKASEKATMDVDLDTLITDIRSGSNTSFDKELEEDTFDNFDVDDIEDFS